jgi:very-short-patch-repair endonuclease
MTEAEKRLWHALRNKQLGIRFRRQQPIGDYIVDFVSFERRIIVEIDGGQHHNSNSDMQRDSWFRKQRFTVLRFWNNDVIRNPVGVLETILKAISPSPNPSHQGRGKEKEKTDTQARKAEKKIKKIVNNNEL